MLEPKEMLAAAGQLYRAKAARGHRYIKVLQVRRALENPYAIVLEVDSRGTRMKGRDRAGILRSMEFNVQLTWMGRAYAMPGRYEAWSRKPRTKRRGGE